MTLLTKNELLERVLAAIEESGWNYKVIAADHPFLIRLEHGAKKALTRVYIWNITHGGGKARAPDEYRIQITGVDGITIDATAKTLLLGWDERYKVFAGYNASNYTSFGSSPSLQIKEGFLKEAKSQGMAIQPKQTYGNEGVTEVAVAIRPDFLTPYILSLEEYHRPFIPVAEMELISKASVGAAKEPEFNIVPTERRKVLRELNQTVRDTRFRSAVLHIYHKSCAFCGFQLGFIEACHIVPVEQKGTDELSNSIALCPNHHGSFDNGLLLVSPDHRVIVNKNRVKELEKTNLTAGLDTMLALDGKKILLPEKADYRPKPEYLKERLRIEGYLPTL